MLHPHSMQALAGSHRADLLSEADRHRLVRAARSGSRSPHQHRVVRLRHGLATTLAATAASAALLLSV